jgi:citrate synthase
VVLASDLTLIRDDRLWYRGLNVAQLARRASFEAVAEFLWSGSRSILDTRPEWPEGDLPPVPLPPEARAIDRLRASVVAAGATDPLRSDLGSHGVMGAGRRIISAMVEGLPLRSASPTRPGPLALAARLWPRLTAARPVRLHLDTLNAILILLADHELAASTFAVRIAASVRADPYSIVHTGLGVIDGALHGSASRPVVALFEEVGHPARAPLVVGERLRQGLRLPGLGHQVYEAIDPRAEVVWQLLGGLPVPARRRDVVEAVLTLVRERVPAVVTIDFALGALVWAAGLGADSAEAMFAVARTAGWIAHALEEYREPPLRFRPRAAYTGLAPSSRAAQASRRTRTPRTAVPR